MEPNLKYPGRAKSAFWSKAVIAVAAALSVLFLPFGFDIESAIIAAGLLTVTYFEFRVHRYFLTDDPRGPGLGFRNQSCFAAAILVYGLYHAYVPEAVPKEYRDMLDAPTLAMIQSVVKNGYLVVGIVGGISQFWLAWYYRSAAKE